MWIHKDKLVGTVMILNDLMTVRQGDFLVAGVLIRSSSHSNRLVVTNIVNKVLRFIRRVINRYSNLGKRLTSTY